MKRTLHDIKQGFIRYREITISAIEVSTVEANLAQKELVTANKELHQLNRLLLNLSENHLQNLYQSSNLIEQSIGDHEFITTLAILLILMMVFSAIYFSRHLSSNLDRINHALISLSRRQMDIHLPEKPDAYLHQLITAVYSFKQALLENDKQQGFLNRTIEQLKDSENRYFSVLNLTPTGIITIDSSQRIVLFNRGAERIFGYKREEIMGQHIEQLLPEQYRSRHNTYINNFQASTLEVVPELTRDPVPALRKDGEQFYIDAAFAKLKLANKTLMTVAITDVTVRKKQQEQITHQAHFDSLTNLPNRLLVLDHLSLLLSDAQRNNTLVAVLFLDLDDFKKVNDSLGHEAGDKVLIEASKRLHSIIRSGDTVGRLGGDEFILLFGGLQNSNDILPVVENVINNFRNTYSIDEHELILTASIGIAMYPSDGDHPSELLRNADSAMYYSKDNGRNTYSFYTQEMNRKALRRFAVEEQIHRALERGEFSVVYQPQYDLENDKIVGAEALLRWYNPALGHVSPVEFIPIAEHTGLIISIGQFVLTEALAMTKQWQTNHHDQFRIAINISPRQFRDPNLVSFIKQAVVQAKIHTEHVELEITEGVLMSGHASIKAALTELNTCGISLAMDDFGTGYSSLSYVRSYPFNVIKIDRSFVKDISVNKAGRELINATIAMAHALNLKVVAEGVETKEQLTYLKQHKCDYAQGFFLGKPVSAEGITQRLCMESE